MCHTIGFILFWMALGMLLMLLIGNKFVGIIVIAVLLIAGYYLYYCNHS